MLKHALYKKALWIAEDMGISTDPDDVYDVLLGNIKGPDSFVAAVQSRLADYDSEVEKNS